MSQQVYKFIKFLEQKEGRTPPPESIIKYGNIKEITEPVQLAAVRKNGHFIKNILEKGIKPSEPVQLAAVKENGYAFKYILEHKIVPSPKVQLAAVKQWGDAIMFFDYFYSNIIEPSPEVKKEAYKSLLRDYGKIPNSYKTYFD